VAGEDIVPVFTNADRSTVQVHQRMARLEGFQPLIQVQGCAQERQSAILVVVRSNTPRIGQR
jgi:hypothetical protein